MIRSLRKKFILVNMLLVLVVLLVVFSTLCIAHYKRLQYDNIRSLEMALSRRDDQRAPRFEVGKEVPPDFMRDPVFVIYTDERGTHRLVMSDNISISDERLALLTEEAMQSGADSGVLRAHNLRYLKQNNPKGIRIAFIDLSGSKAMLRNTILTSVLMCVAAIAAFFFISLFLSRWALRPVEDAWRRQRQFVADASHELKTPLTVILANIGILKSNRADTIAHQIGWVENTETEAGRMKKLVDSLLFLAKTDDAKAPVVYSKLNFSDVIFGAALAFESVAYERGVTVDTDRILPDVYVSGNEPQIAQVAGILLDNAVKYSEQGGSVTLTLFCKQEKAVFSVHNTGSFLSEEDLRQVFDRFYRADKSRSNEGYGLGLSIAQSIAESHNGKISAESHPERGTTFTVALPLYE